MSEPSSRPLRPVWLDILAGLAEARGARVHVEPVYGYAGYIEAADGRRHFFKGTNFDINGAGAASLAKDKDYAGRMLAEAGLPVPEAVLIHAPRRRYAMALKNPVVASRLATEAAAEIFAETVGWPVFVKPNEGSEGEGVMKAGDREALGAALGELFQLNDRVLVQKAVGGNDYRVVVLDGEVLAAFHRVPLRVSGDGRSMLGRLIEMRIAELGAEGRGRRIAADDPRILKHLMADGRSFEDIPARDETVTLLPNANLSTGGTATDATATLTDEARLLAVSAARALGLRFAGVDLMLEDGGAAHLLEVNAAPGLSYFHRLGKREAAIVEAIYARLFEAITAD
ncbi:ATP-dependent carboxylate-amine ligase [Stappia sp. F7233]|uniref:ATP-dependent carboxylate-amine ligase n=1 Tax=Stappia albiluteola TaxID=2758565 RepID=A0A839AI74_9HYPH|nr:ATP-dependent carboxylate-amine ligase [Stappia albiluteola]MBA5778624.1 ATP-dependent carboxylate-amine ligase [Stappia albiluteola]